MAGSPADDTRTGPLGAIYKWLTRSTPPARSSGEGAPDAERLPARLGHYAIERKLGQGGMGTVYAARDERLHRAVAIKTISAVTQDEKARRRFWREARAAASVNHPNVCQIYEIGEDDGQLFIAMELLEGTALSARLGQGPLPVSEAVDIGLAMLGALSALHARGIVHRDLKPSNVFLTPQGVKLLDFGLARASRDPAGETMPDLTQPGTVAGTPRYMAPEQVLGKPIDPRTDLFAAGAMLFEMLAGRPPFEGRTVVEILHGTVYENPPALCGSPTVAAVDRVIRRAMAKAADERQPSARAMADELRAVGLSSADDMGGQTRALTRLVVLPFRLLRPDAEIDFLAFSLPDAITTSVSSHASLIVRSTATASRFAGEAPDFKAIGVEADVDRVVSGTLLRSGDDVRVSVQLVEAPSGTVMASHTVQAPLTDLFTLQDDVARRVVEALSPSLAGAAPSSPTPASNAVPRGGAYELYLRGNDLARTYEGLNAARTLYEQCLAVDPGYAPAWARLGRCHRVIGKFMQHEPDSQRRAEDALRRALELNPRLTIAHKFYANLEADTGRAIQAVTRLLAEAIRHGNDPELFAGLVHACRYCGLYDESIAAHDEARRLDPHIATSVEQSLMLAGRIDRLLAMERAGLDPGADHGIRVITLGLFGRRDEARRELPMMRRPGIPLVEHWMGHLAAWLDRRPDEMRAGLIRLEQVSNIAVFEDPEALFQEGWMFCDAGDHAHGMTYLSRAVDRGYFAAFALRTSPHFDPLRETSAFQSLLADAEAGRERALAAFREAGGEQLLRAETPG